jgi:hypothetical protein
MGALQKNEPPKGSSDQKPLLPALLRNFGGIQPSFFENKHGSGKLPQASIIYGIAAAVLFVVAIYFFFTAAWFTGILLLVPAGCLMGFALQFLRFAK